MKRLLIVLCLFFINAGVVAEENTRSWQELFKSILGRPLHDGDDWVGNIIKNFQIEHKLSREQINGEINKIFEQELTHGNTGKEFGGACALVGDYGNKETARLAGELVEKMPSEEGILETYLVAMDEELFPSYLRDKILSQPEKYDVSFRYSSILTAFDRYEKGTENFKMQIRIMFSDYIEAIENDYYVVSEIDKFLIKEIPGYKDSTKRKANANRRGWKEMPVDWRPPPMLDPPATNAPPAK